MTADLPYLFNALFLASLNPSLLLAHLHFPLLTHKENITEGCRRENPYNLYHLYKLWCHQLYYPLTSQYRPGEATQSRIEMNRSNKDCYGQDAELGATRSESGPVSWATMK